MICYPFSAIVGQDDLKLSLLLNAVSPEVGGVLIRGEKGTAKSTAARALASLLPPIRVVSGCPFSCDPKAPNLECPAGPHPPDAPSAERPVRLVELPVGASTDRLTGTLDLEKALTEGRRAFEPGVLAAAHRGILYVDEVNLLPDHLVDALLDAAAMGTNHVEREGVSVRHPARFVLVGTMNPEEGELRPQLLDRFGLSVEVAGSPEPGERAEVVSRRLLYEADPGGFAALWEGEERELSRRVLRARGLLPSVRLPEEMLRRVSEVCSALGVDGLRGDIVTAKTARALAAWEGRGEVSEEDVRRAALLALPHRRRRAPFEQPGLEPEELDGLLSGGEEPDPPEGGGEPGGERPGSGERRFSASGSFDPAGIEAPGRGQRGAPGRRSRAAGEHGHPVGAREAGREIRDLAPAATLRAAAPHQAERGREGGGLVLRPEDLREKVREGREGNLLVLVVDSSGSMAARSRMSAVKGAVRALLEDAYRRRDRAAVISFRGEEARLLVPPASGVEAAAARLEELPTGGRTPLAAGLELAAETVLREASREPERRPLLVVITDGRATAGEDPLAAARRLRERGVPSVVVDTEGGFVRLGLAAELAGALGARYVRLEELEERRSA
ncbi:protoporphyrin IX magnesium-chelatase [Rubrobacter xylanophilus DSM 9941]|uniref:Mg-protoporphyrin IX chelatase n=1 Tax=Rubrobacter xylanophilus (strain DSM 9941 / JCM 11954 / NBRC 16129 / PRD-1) TaxID=266117 RepID=Q1AYC2_RUBXD|nr:magnesium chelatase subunit D family protein [Rubrobacter xylanophilus]ABG03606.1 protoporphyrin IX magnesium-chelatase [Rubrobacter xylanophilus DSM 9941]